ncbi:SsgA family sporulation/cell division regulator [Streptomyces sp. NPDC057623]|uniref:SsgA family sporulation/cell division regulator n=1 Tax=Streptomyces sp. NPDC057623 TaxID=3346187 RepID=UPI00368DE16A
MENLDDLTSVVCRILVHLLVEDGVDQPVIVDLRYTSADPYAVVMTFHPSPDARVRWVIGRDLLLGGRNRLVGVGDVQIWPSQHASLGKVCIGLRPRGNKEAVVVVASGRSLDAFLRRTLVVVPVGTEERHLDMDGTVQQLLSGPDKPDMTR